MSRGSEEIVFPYLKKKLKARSKKNKNKNKTVSK